METELAKAVPSLSWLPVPEWLAVALAHRFLGESLLTWTLAILTFFGSYALIRGAITFGSKKLERLAAQTATGVDDVVVSVLKGTGRYSCFALSLYLAARHIELKPGFEKFLRIVLVLAFSIQIGVWIDKITAKVISLWRGVHESPQDATLAAGLRFGVRIITWILLVLAALSNLGVEVGAVLAGLGVGGIAAALAVQNILGDLFAGISMFFDRPFHIGDFIVVGELRGKVQRIGLRTTRIMSLDGEQIVVPNGDLVKAKIRNFARMEERRLVVRFSIEYNTKAADLMRARDLAAKAIQSVQGVRLDRVHFYNLGDSGIEYEAVFIVESADMTLAMDLQQAILFEIYRTFEEGNIVFAFPSRTVYVKPDSSMIPLARELSEAPNPSTKPS